VSADFRGGVDIHQLEKHRLGTQYMFQLLRSLCQFVEAELIHDLQKVLLSGNKVADSLDGSQGRFPLTPLPAFLFDVLYQQDDSRQAEQKKGDHCYPDDAKQLATQAFAQKRTFLLKEGLLRRGGHQGSPLAGSAVAARNCAQMRS